MQLIKVNLPHHYLFSFSATRVITVWLKTFNLCIYSVAQKLKDKDSGMGGLLYMTTYRPGSWPRLQKYILTFLGASVSRARRMLKNLTFVTSTCVWRHNASTSVLTSKGCLFMFNKRLAEHCLQMYNALQAEPEHILPMQIWYCVEKWLQF